jgi:hypothetical protein
VGLAVGMLVVGAAGALVIGLTVGLLLVGEFDC